jgi:hypothetical protein
MIWALISLAMGAMIWLVMEACEGGLQATINSS